MSKTFGATLLIVGTTIGAGMLGLPVETGKAGFFPSIFMMLLVWAATTISALLLADVVLAGKKGVNFSSLAEKHLGALARGATLLSYFLLFFSLITAYTKGGGGFVADFFGLEAVSTGSYLFVLFFLPFLFIGPYLVEKLNSLFALILFGSYFALVFAGIQYVDSSLLATHSIEASFFSIPLMVTAFSYHGTLPTIIEYLERDSYRIKKAILLGSVITFLIYLLWQYLLLGIIPFSGEESLSAARQADKTAMLYLERITKSKTVALWAIAFSFAALTTSFLGVSLGVIDFFRDLFGWKQTIKNRVLITAALLIPALLLSTLQFPIFYFSLKYGAGISCIFLLIFLPAAMWKRIRVGERKLFGLPKKSLVKGVYAFCALALLFAILNLL